MYTLGKREAWQEALPVLIAALYAVLRNDQQSLTEQLDKKLQEYFSEVSSKPRRQSDKEKDRPQSSGRVQYAEVPTQPSGSAEPIRPFAIGKFSL